MRRYGQADVLKSQTAVKNKAGPKETFSGTFVLCACLLICVFFSGFINLIPTGSLFPATVIIDCLCILMFAGYVTAAMTREGVRIPPWVIAFVLLTVVYVCLFANGNETLYDKYLNLRNEVLYAFVAVFISANLKSKNEAIRLLRLAMRFSVVLAIFGIVQFVFRSTLPEWLLVSRDTTVFGYYGTDITRSTGLIGNTIVYSNMLLLFFTFHLAKMAHGFKFRDSLGAVILFTSIILTFSRVAIAGSVSVAVVLLVYVVAKRRPTPLVILASGASLFGFIGLTWIFLSEQLIAQLGSSFIYSDLFLNQNASVQSSTSLHNVYIDIALKIVQEDPWFGIGIASQGQNSLNAQSSTVITDGAFWSLLAEGGIVLLASYFVFLIICAVTAFKTIKFANFESYVPIAFLVFSAYEFFASAIYNSSFFGKAPFILYWFIFGIVVVVGRKSDQPQEVKAHNVSFSPK